MVTKLPRLTYNRQGLITIMDTHYSDYVNDTIVFQLGKDGLLYRITFFSKNFNLAQHIHEIYDKSCWL